MAVDPLRVRRLNEAPLRGDGDFVLYWMTAARRTRYNPALERSVALARESGRPLLVLDALRAGYRWASARHHRFAIEGMRDVAEELARSGALHYPYVEPEVDAGKGLLAALARRAVAVVADDSPAFFFPRMLAAAVPQVPVRFEAVDGCGLLPLRAADRAFTAAQHFRRHLQKTLPEHLEQRPAKFPLRALPRVPVPDGALEEIRRRWPTADLPALLRPGGLDALPIDAEVPPAPRSGGSRAGRTALRAFLRGPLAGYAEDRNRVDRDGTSGLSPYLHWGHVSAHEVFAEWASHAGWTTERLAWKPTGSRVGWWGADADGEAFLDQLVTWRELSFNGAARIPGYDRYASLPEWARRTLDAHASDPRPALYPLAALEGAETGDPLWNAAQRELRREGRIHNYLRMLWGKRVLEWTRRPPSALRRILRLNDRWALDGRDPNSVSGILWCLGRYDRPWFPERPVFGVVRFMSSAATARKMRVGEYLARYG